MKKILSFLCFLLPLALAAPQAALAESHQVTQLTATAASVIIIPGQKATIVCIQNIGSNAVNLTFDGGSSGGGSDPGLGSTGGGFQLAAGATVTFYGPYIYALKISAVTQTGTTTLNITTNAPVGSSTFPTS